MSEKCPKTVLKIVMRGGLVGPCGDVRVCMSPRGPRGLPRSLPGAPGAPGALGGPNSGVSGFFWRGRRGGEGKSQKSGAAIEFTYLFTFLDKSYRILYIS